MVSIRATVCVALSLTVLSAPAWAAGPAQSANRATGKQVPANHPIAQSPFDLTAGRVANAPVVRTPASARAKPARGAQFGNGKTASIEGPSWSYQTSRRGPTFEMGALGGGAMENAPFLAHVAMAWQF